MTSTAGTDARTKVYYAIDRLKEKFPASVPFDDLASYMLSVDERRNRQQVNLIKQFLRVNPKVDHDPANDTYRFRPLHNIATADDLLAYFQRQETALGLNVRDLKEAWPNVEDTIDQLEKENKLLVTRNKKDNHPRMVWSNDPSLIAPLDPEFKEFWHQVTLPNTEDVIRELTRMNHTPTGELRKPENAPKVEKKKKKVRRGNKVTNVHMQSLFRDYSNQRPQGTK